MPCVIVVLDESAFSESILPSALRLAGEDGRVVLIEALKTTEDGEARLVAKGAVQSYLDDVAQQLRARRIDVETRVYPEHGLEHAVEAAVEEFGGDMVATATEAREGSHAFTWGDSAWRLLAHSHVPILLRHGELNGSGLSVTRPHVPSRIMVPLDGSDRAEKALPLAETLARQWDSTIVLVRVTDHDRRGEADSYLGAIAARLSVPVELHVQVGAAEAELVKAALSLHVTDIIMTSHGRTGLPRILLGSVAASLLHEVLVPIVIVPVLSAVTRTTRRHMGRRTA